MRGKHLAGRLSGPIDSRKRQPLVLASIRIPRTGFHNMRIVLAWVLACAATAVQAQSPLTASEQDVIDFGFATQLGSGVYTMSGRTLQVYRLPFAYRFDGAEDARIRARLTLPVTLGFLDFKPLDVVDTGLPDSVDSLSFVPGLLLEIAISPRWRLEPFAEAGIARDRSSDVDQRIYAAGLRSIYDVTDDGTAWQLYDELLYSAVEQRSLDQSNDFARLRIGVTARRPFDVAGYGRRPDYLVYGFGDVFLDAPTSPLNGEERDGGDAQFELGVTFGTTEPLRLWRIPLPRIGLGYRFGEDLSVYRLVFGGPF